MIDKIGNSRSPQACQVCHKVLSTRGSLVKHMVIHQEEKPFKCDKCEMRFNQKRDFNTHIMQKHTLQRPHVCEICHKGFVHKFYLIEHMTYHSGDRQYQCTQCGKRFQAQSALTKHSKVNVYGATLLVRIIQLFLGLIFIWGSLFRLSMWDMNICNCEAICNY